MRFLTVHARYMFRGGEDQVHEAERDLLREHGHDVEEYVKSNKLIQGNKPWMTGLRSIWSQGDYTAIRAVIRKHRPEIVTVHNFFPLISPAVFYAARAEGVPVVQTLHNFRLICPSAGLLRDGRICEDCVGKPVPLPGVLHACYRKSSLLSAGVAAMTSAHRLIGTWNHMVDRYIVLSDFMKDRFTAGGLPSGKITVKPNFTRDAPPSAGSSGDFLFVGRLSREKGVATLLEAWRLAGTPGALRIVGKGPEEMDLRAQAALLPSVSFLGELSRDAVGLEMGKATALILPSVWLEPFGLTAIEAFARGTPVIASDLGALPSLIEHGKSGLLFQAGNAQALAELLRGWHHSPELRAGARRAYEARFTPEKNYTQMMAIYDRVLQARRSVRA